MEITEQINIAIESIKTLDIVACVGRDMLSLILSTMLYIANESFSFSLSSILIPSEEAEMLIFLNTSYLLFKYKGIVPSEE